MPGIGFGELAVIFLLLLVFLGPKRLPQAARTFGRVMGEVRRATDELKTALYLEEARTRRADPARDPYARKRRASASRTGPAGTGVRAVERPDAPPPSAPPPDEAEAPVEKEASPGQGGGDDPGDEGGTS